MIPLSKNTINENDIFDLCDWLKTFPRLSKDELTIRFEEEWSKWLGVKYSVFVNSGSSANLAMVYSLIQSKRLKNKNVICPNISWITTVSPIIQLGLKPILCECDKETLGIDVNHLEKLCKKYNPSCLIIVNVLGIPCHMKEIEEICNKYDIILIEDSCESVGSLYNNKKTGTFGLMSSFSCYIGHHFSTIEGGIVSTNDKELYNILKSIRSHGWDRDLDKEEVKNKRDKYDIDDFRGLYTFYYPGFNLRNTEIGAFLGLEQLKKIDSMVEKRNKNLLLYDKLIKNDYWKLNINNKNVFISNFAYPIIHPKKMNIVKELQKNEVEVRPLVCGSMGRHPFWKELRGNYQYFPFSDEVHDNGLYVPNNADITEDEIKFISEIINGVIK